MVVPGDAKAVMVIIVIVFFESGRMEEREQARPEILPSTFIRRDGEVAGQRSGLEHQ